MTEPKLCKDCRWATNLAVELAQSYPYDWACEHPSSRILPEPPSLVDGTVRGSRRALCEVVRHSTLDSMCGPEGRFWEPREG
jgi:hypothetical protein